MTSSALTNNWSVRVGRKGTRPTTHVDKLMMMDGLRAFRQVVSEAEPGDKVELWQGDTIRDQAKRQKPKWWISWRANCATTRQDWKGVVAFLLSQLQHPLTSEILVTEGSGLRATSQRWVRPEDGKMPQRSPNLSERLKVINEQGRGWIIDVEDMTLAEALFVALAAWRPDSVHTISWTGHDGGTKGFGSTGSTEQYHVDAITGDENIEHVKIFASRQKACTALAEMALWHGAAQLRKGDKVQRRIYEAKGLGRQCNPLDTEMVVMGRGMMVLAVYEFSTPGEAESYYDRFVKDPGEATLLVILRDRGRELRRWWLPSNSPRPEQVAQEMVDTASATPTANLLLELERADLGILKEILHKELKPIRQRRISVEGVAAGSWLAGVLRLQRLVELLEKEDES